MKQCVITSAARTAVGAYLGSLKTVRAMDLGGAVISAALERSGISKDLVDQTIFGEVTGTGNVARAAALVAGLSESVPGYTVDRQCGSSLQAVINATQEINAEAGEVIVAGGVETMSRMYYIMPESVRYEGFRLGTAKIQDLFSYSAETKCQPPEVYPRLNMGITAENVAEKYNISREAQDAFAYESQMKTKAAMEAGKFKDEIIPFEVKLKKKSFIFDTDEHPKPDTTLEGLASLRPSFKPDGTVTAGNSSGMNDGASAVVVMSEDKAKELGCKPLVKVVSYATSGVDPRYMGIGPVTAVGKALSKAGLTLNDMGLIELNEAFAAQSLGVLTELNMLPGTELYTRLNVNGGAIAHGHALGNSGTRLLNTLIYEMKRRGVQYGLATLCIGGGQGIAMIIENCK